MLQLAGQVGSCTPLSGAGARRRNSRGARGRQDLARPLTSTGRRNLSCNSIIQMGRASGRPARGLGRGHSERAHSKRAQSERARRWSRSLIQFCRRARAPPNKCEMAEKKQRVTKAPPPAHCARQLANLGLVSLAACSAPRLARLARLARPLASIVCRTASLCLRLLLIKSINLQ